jgi:hypothetical protein
MGGSAAPTFERAPSQSAGPAGAPGMWEDYGRSPMASSICAIGRPGSMSAETYLAFVKVSQVFIPVNVQKAQIRHDLVARPVELGRHTAQQLELRLG